MVNQSDTQEVLCQQYGVEPDMPSRTEILGIAIATLGQAPLNGLRHRPAKGTCGWYIWAGDTFTDEADFFQPLHVRHLEERCPEAIRFLALPPGWRFLTDGEHTDVWQDLSLLDSK